MDFSIKEVLGIISVTLSMAALVPYVRSIFKGQTTPHIFSFIIWGITMCIAFIAQVINGAGAGSWTVGFGAFYCIFIAILAIKYGEKEITKQDWLFLFMALSIIPIWITTKNDLLAIMLATLIDLIGYLPTFRKTYKKPYSENLTAYLLTGISYFVALFALQEFNYTTAMYPFAVFVTSFALIAMALWRRKTHMDASK